MRTLCAMAWLVVLSGCGGSDGPSTCQSDEQCALPELCSAAGFCAAPEPREEGQPCAHESHCKSQLCLRESPSPRPDAGAPELAVAEAGTVDGSVANDLASVDLSTDTDRGSITDLGSSDAATADSASLPSGWGTCRRPCEKPADCEGGTVCSPTVGTPMGQVEALVLVCGATGGDRHLVEECQNDLQCHDGVCQDNHCTRLCGDCPSQMQCTSLEIDRRGFKRNAMLCTQRPLLSFVELGPVDTPKVGANPITFAIDAKTVSFVVAAIDDDRMRVGIRQLIAPDGRVLVDLDNPQDAAMKVSPYIGSSAAIVPGSESIASPVQSGTYTLTLATYDPQYFDRNEPVDGSLERVVVITRRNDLQGGVLDLNVHLAPGSGVTADQAPGSATIQSTLTRLRGLYQQTAGVTLGKVRYFDLPQQYDTVADGDSARQLCAGLSRGTDGQAINVALIEDLGFTAGFAGQIAAPPAIYGLPTSCIVIERQSSANTTGVLMAHELGHHLGLWHTTELDGGQDALADTPVCPDGTAIKQCPDYRNLMFPTFPVTDPLALSAAQRYVLRKSPWLYESVIPEACGTLPATLMHDRFGAGVTAGSSLLAGRCGGDQQPERIHLLRLTTAHKKLVVRADAPGFAVALYVRRGDCSASDNELGCAMAGGPAQNAEVEIENPAVGAYYIVVDGVDGAGFYTVSARLED